MLMELSPSTRIFNPIPRILNLITWNDLKGCVPLKPQQAPAEHDKQQGGRYV